MLPENDTLLQGLQKMYATVLELPEEVVTPDVDLEAELGLDSLQHRIVLARAGELWAVDTGDSESPATLTLRSVADLLRRSDSTTEA
ncbi:acyl carrier protein [Micromonospora olivasterospora]|uniref:Phosphopantetheine binding protein n=1 Tax=Micromonospora olivasterospora TaxID=1880 RepID=A0A562II40_MICOL|nr:phosphopantetheine-binding protein [Micromonospora olivasterospora]TWH70691.1 phosphopantetheine binding protein [Micromonospora olivasterospora]